MAYVSPNYFGVMGLRLLAGRFFTEADLALAEQDKDAVVIVNQSFAQKFFSGEDPLGRRLLKSDKKNAYLIVGVVSDYRAMGVEGGARPQIFWPYLKLSSATLVARATVAPESLAQPLQKAVASVDKDLPLEFRTMEHYVDQWQAQRKFNTLLLSVFAGLALVLALIGIYGVLANLVASRTREIGIRMALGARPVEIGRLVLRQTMIPVAIGLSAGLAGSLALGRFLEALLFQLRARDPVTLVLAVLAILLLSPAAIAIPLRRAVRVDCTVALREE
jgi:ABC-type antimicrobial peptide transport system permease subunit